MTEHSNYVISSHKINKELFNLFDLKTLNMRCSVVINMKESFIIINTDDIDSKSRLTKTYYKIINSNESKGWMNYNCEQKDITESYSNINLNKEDIEIVCYKIEYKIPDCENTYISQLVLCKPDSAVLINGDEYKKYSISMFDLINKIIENNSKNIINVVFIYDSNNSDSKQVFNTMINNNNLNLYKNISLHYNDNIMINITKQLSKEEYQIIINNFTEINLTKEIRIVNNNKTYIKIIGDSKPTTEYITTTINTTADKDYNIKLLKVNETKGKATVPQEIKEYNGCLVYKSTFNNWNIEIVISNSFKKEILEQFISNFKQSNEKSWIESSRSIILNCNMSINNNNLVYIQRNINTISNLLSNDTSNIDNVLDNINYMLGKKGIYTIKRLTNQANSLSKHIYGDIYPPIDWNLTVKADGVHVLVYISDGKMYIVESKIYKISNTNNSYSHLFEGEIVIDKNDDVILLLFDVLYINSKNLTKLNTSKRLSYLEEAKSIVNNILSNRDIGRLDILKYKKEEKQLIDINKVKRVESKTWIKINKDNIKKYFDDIYYSEYDYLNDGLILMNDENYYDSLIYKWKPADKMTIDFLVKKCPDNLLGVIPYYIKDGKTLYWLFCGITSSMYKKLQKSFPNNYISSKHGRNIDKMIKIENYFPIPFTPSSAPLIYLYYDERTDLDGKIIELSWDYVDNKWKFERERLDRNLDLSKGNYYGNDYKTAELNWININNPLKYENLYDYNSSSYFKENKLEKYKYQTNYNSFVKSLLIEKYCKDVKWVIDLATGKGQDLNKYARSNIKHLTMIDIDNDAISIALERKFNNDKNLYDITALVTDLNKVDESFNKIQNLRDQVSDLKDNLADVIVCNFAIHYLIENITSLASMIKKLLKKDGMFIFTTFDGSTIIDKLNKLKKGESWTLSEDDEIKYKIEKRFESKSDTNDTKKIGVLLPFSKTELYEESLVNINKVIDTFTSIGFKKVISGSFNPDEISKVFYVAFPAFVNNLSDVDKEFISLYSYTVLINKT